MNPYTVDMIINCVVAYFSMASIVVYLNYKTEQHVSARRRKLIGQ